MGPPKGRPDVASVAHWTVATLSFCLVVVLFISMDFGDRGYHFDKERTYAGDVGGSGTGDGYDLSRLRLLQRCVTYVRANYVDPSRADARAMLVAALDDVERRVPELMSDPVRDGLTITGVHVRVGDSERTFDLRRVSDLYTMVWKLLDVFEYLAPRLSGTVEAREVEYAAVNGMLRTLDPHSVLLTPSIYREMKLGTTGKFGGLGIVIGIQDGRIIVQSVLDGTPARRAGLKSGDKIIQIGAESTVNMSLTDAVKRLRGPPGTPVTVWVARKSFTEPRKYRIVRSNITLASVTSRLLEGGIGYARVKNFQQSTAADLEAAIERMAAERRDAGAEGLDGFILDLRDNPGGLLDQAIEVSDLFLRDGVIVTTVGNGSKVREETVATVAGTASELPLVVLVNSGSASASEIVAGALRNHDRAVIVGSTTFGKGSVQVIYDIDDAALKLTVAQYLTPGDESIQSVGITPHVALVPVVVSNEHVDLNTASEAGESALTNHLENGTRTRHHEPDARVTYLTSDQSEDHDFALELAERMLGEARHTVARQMLVRARPIFALSEREQGKRIVEALGKLDIDWNDGTNPSRARVHSILTTDHDHGQIEAGRKIALKLSVTNQGRNPLYRVRAVTQSEVELFAGHDFLLGRIPPGETRSWSVEIDVPRSMTSQLVPVTAALYHDEEAEPLAGAREARANVEVDGLPRPRFAYTIQVDDVGGGGNGDGVANENERIGLRVRVENIGEGAALKTLAVVKNRGAEEAFITDGREWLDGLAPGEAREVTFEIEVREGATTDGLQLDLQLTDTVLRHRMTHRLDIPFAPTPGGIVVEREGRWATTADAGTRLWAGASRDTGALARLAPGTRVHSDGRLGEWLRVPLEGGGRGWLRVTDLSEAADSDNVPQTLKIERTLQVRQPTIDLTETPALATDAPTIRVSGAALFPTLDEGERPDVYIFRASNKVYFARATDAPDEVGFDAVIPLEPGHNEIAIYARAGRDLMYKKRLYVYRR